MGTTQYYDDQEHQGQKLNTKQEEFIKNGELRAIDKYVHFNKNMLFIEDPKHWDMLREIKRVIELHPSTGDPNFNPRFLEIYVETVLFCQIVRRYNQDELLTEHQLNDIFGWLSEIVNSFVHF